MNTHYVGGSHGAPLCGTADYEHLFADRVRPSLAFMVDCSDCHSIAGTEPDAGEEAEALAANFIVGNIDRSTLFSQAQRLEQRTQTSSTTKG